MAPPDWAVRLVRAGRGLLFLDELSTAPPAVQAALLRLVLERRVGALQLPPGVRIVAAANPRSSAADGWELSPPLANRFVHLQWTHDHDVVVRGLGGTWPRATLPRLDPDTARRMPSTFARRAVCGLLAARPALVHRLPSSETAPRRRLALAAQLGHDPAADRLRHGGRHLPGGAVPAGPGHGRRRPRPGTAGQPRPDGPARPGGSCWPTRPRPILPERGDLRQAVLDARGGGGPPTAGRVPLGRGLGGAGHGRWRPAPRTWWSCPRPRSPRCATRTGTCRRRSNASPGGVAVPASRPRRSPRRRKGRSMTPDAASAGPRQALRRPPARRPGPALPGDGAVRAAPVESRRVPTMAVDRHWRCYVSPGVRGPHPGGGTRRRCWVHEVSHLLRDHHGRGDRFAARARPDRPGRAAADEHRRGLRDQRRRVRRRAGPARGRRRPGDAAAARRAS